VTMAPSFFMPANQYFRTIFVLAALLLAYGLPTTTKAQSVETRETEELVNYAYSAILGTGYYEVGDQKVHVITLPFTWTQWKAGEGHRYGLK
jgi:hypothetical protein